MHNPTYLPTYRPLDTQQLAKQFLINVCQRKDDKSTADLARKISRLEIVNKQQLEDNTLVSTKYCDEKYSKSSDRNSLRETVVEELATKERLRSDDGIELGQGGALPRTPTKFLREAFIILGPPASGKSKIANYLADFQGAIMLDPDFAKRKLPEYDGGKGAACIHEESSGLIFGKKFLEGSPVVSLFERLIPTDMNDSGPNLVIPKVGSDQKKIQTFMELLWKKGYKTHLCLVSLDRQKAVGRALWRFELTNRYVPLSHIFDEVGNQPQLTYYRLCRDFPHKKKWISHAAYSTDVLPDEPPKPICASKHWPGISFGGSQH